MTPITGKVGTTVTLSIISTSYQLDGDYKIRWSPTATFDNEDLIMVLAEGNVPKGGYDVEAVFKVPEARYGINYVQYVRFGRDDPFNLQFTVKPTLSVTPASVKPESTVTISGTGFPAGDTVSIKFDGETAEVVSTDEDAEDPAIVKVNEIGSFAATFTVPKVAAGAHEFIADASKMYTDTTAASVEIVPYILLSPELPEIGTRVVVSGCGFAANSVGHLKYDDKVIANSPTTGENGCFSYDFVIPEGSETQHIIVVTDEAGNTSSFGLPLEGKPPPNPAPVTPRDQRFGILGDETVTFSWTEVADPSGITYTVEVGENLNFFPLKPGMRKADLAQTNCAMVLEPGTYYWRVKATDGVGNESEWVTSPYAFKVGLLSVWAIVIGAVIFIIVFALLIRAFFRRLSEYYH
jgi:hypothetical protein